MPNLRSDPEHTNTQRRRPRFQINSILLFVATVLGTLVAAWQVELLQKQPTEGTAATSVLAEPTVDAHPNTELAMLRQRIGVLERTLAAADQRPQRPAEAAPKAAMPPQVAATGSATDLQPKRSWFEESMTQHRRAPIATAWAAAMTAQVETLVVQSTQAEQVRLAYLDCRAGSCELHLELTEEHTPHLETHLLGALGRILPEQQVRKDGRQLTVIARQSA